MSYAKEKWADFLVTWLLQDMFQLLREHGTLGLGSGLKYIFQVTYLPTVTLHDAEESTSLLQNFSLKQQISRKKYTE